MSSRRWTRRRERSAAGYTSSMFFVQFEATPRRDARVEPAAAGAYVNCWIERPTLYEAVEDARGRIEEQGWIAGEPDEAYEVDETDYPPGQAGREYFQQALIDKWVLVFYTFPERDEDEPE